jgi:HlyD family secretion protein
LGDPTRENVRLQLTTLNASKVRINQGARVSMIGPNPKTFMGRVVSLSPQASAPTSEGSFGSQPQAKVDATVALDRPSNTLIPGSQVSVEIVLNQRRNVLTLPLEAIQQLEAQPFVWIKNRVGRAEKRPVQLGLQSLTTVEVKSGLKAGEVVALPSATQPLTVGAALKADPSAAPTPTP